MTSYAIYGVCIWKRHKEEDIMLMADTAELAYALCEILDDGNLAVREWEGVAAVYRRENPEARPEAVTAALPEGDGYDICAIWDMGKHVLVHTGDAGEAVVFAAAAAWSLSANSGEIQPYRWIQETLGKGEEGAVAGRMRSWYGDNLCSIGKEDPCKISMVRTKKGMDVMFARRYAARGVDTAMAYTVLDRCCRLLEMADKLCRKSLEAGITVNQEVLKLLIVFGNADNGEKRQKKGTRP